MGTEPAAGLRAIALARALNKGAQARSSPCTGESAGMLTAPPSFQCIWARVEGAARITAREFTCRSHLLCSGTSVH